MDLSGDFHWIIQRFLLDVPVIFTAYKDLLYIYLLIKTYLNNSATIRFRSLADADINYLVPLSRLEFNNTKRGQITLSGDFYWMKIIWFLF